MTNELVLGISLIFILGVVGYWLAWQLRLPALVVLFAVGLVAGPAMGLIDPDALLGPLLFPAISLALGLILFQAGLMLRLQELPDVGTLMLRLILLVAPLAVGAVTALASFLLGLDVALSLLLGSLLVLPAPLVIGPLLARVPLQGRVGPALKWEATVMNPVGAVVAILLFEAVLGGDLSQAPGAILYGAGRALLVGLGVGVGGGVALRWLLEGRRVPTSLRNSIVVLLLLVTLLLANWLQADAGLLALLVAGVLFANQKRVDIRPVVSFVDGLHVLLAGPLLLVLAARLDPALFVAANWAALFLFTLLLLLARPLALLVAGWGSGLSLREQLFMGWTAPRGVVPVALGAVFALELGAVGHTGAEWLAFVPVLTTLVTAAVVWLAAGPLARRLHVAAPEEISDSTPISPGVAFGDERSK